MTALVSVLNKRGAAIAADSAMTVTNDDSRRIYNNEQKIFPLSDSNPVAVMICNNLTFLSTPLSLIFELYKSERGQVKYPSLTGYVEDFLSYLKSMKILQIADVKNVYYCNEFLQFMKTLQRIEKNKFSELQEENSNSSEDELISKSFYDALDRFSELIYAEDIHSSLKNFSKEDFERDIIDQNKEFFERQKSKFEIEDKDWHRILEMFYRDLINDTYGPPQATEIIFTGYGEDDIFPATQRVFISGMVGDQIKYYVEEIGEITHDNSAEIRPFAQTDVMFSLMKGVSPLLDEEYSKALEEAEDSIIEEIASILDNEKVDSEIIQKVNTLSLEKINERYYDRRNSFISENYTSGVIDAVECFNLEELAKMAENLISVTNLQRHISAEEETVGGPIEVAIITKTGGFKWIKHCNLT